MQMQTRVEHRKHSHFSILIFNSENSELRKAESVDFFKCFVFTANVSFNDSDNK